MKRILFLSVVAMAMILATSAFARDFIRHKMEKQVLIRGDEAFQNVRYYPSRPGLITQSPGVIIGWTQDDYQTSCSTRDRAALGFAGAVNLCWMGGHIAPDGNWERQAYFNCVSEDGTPTYPEGMPMGERSGRPTLANFLGDEALFALHRTTPTYEVFAAVAAVPCSTVFTEHLVGNLVDGVTAIWPDVTIDRNENVHIVISNQDAFGYTNSTDGGQSWGRPDLVDNIATISPVITSSPVSDKVAIVYTKDVGQQWRGDVVYFESPDGLSWDFGSDPANVTEYGQGGDSLWAYCDVDAVYDYNDNLHIIWNAHYATETSVYIPVWLYHYDTESGTITQMAESESPDFDSCDTGAWNTPIAKMSIGVQESNNALFAVYTYFPEDDCSATGFSNAELYMQFSVDGGGSWSEPNNITESSTPGCSSGECDSDHWSSLAERVEGGVLHIIYINDKDAGGMPQGEGAVTDNPVMYLAYGPSVGVALDESIAPSSFALSQNYPNPFNASTTLQYNLPAVSDVKIEIYDILGRRVETLVQGEQPAGYHQITWDASNFASGIYFARARMSQISNTIKLIYLK